MKRLLSVVLSVCIIVSALGAMPAMATTSAVGGSVSSGVVVRPAAQSPAALLPVHLHLQC